MGWSMRYILRLIMIMFLVVQLALGDRVTFYEVAVTLIIVAMNIYREKYLNSVYIVLVEAVIIFLAVGLNPYFIVLYGITAYDLVLKRYYAGIIPIAVLGLYFLKGQRLVEYLLVIGLSCLYAYASRILKEREKVFKEGYDKERRYRYELEAAKAKLLNSSREVAHLAEIKERNRIAREIHDSIGHNIAGILLQLQAAYKVHGRDQIKSMELLKNSIDGLSASLTLLRDTVHNIKPGEGVGIEYIEEIIRNFSFCEVCFNHSGDFNKIPVSHIEILASNIKEALTNASKHSNAARVDILIEVKDKFTRLFIKDNGKGCSNIKEGLGLSGMRERIKNIGGSISISSADGFIIVCIIPVESNGGGSIFEGSNS